MKSNLRSSTPNALRLVSNLLVLMRAQKRNFEFDPSASSAVFFGIEA